MRIYAPAVNRLKIFFLFYLYYSQNCVDYFFLVNHHCFPFSSLVIDAVAPSLTTNHPNLSSNMHSKIYSSYMYFSNMYSLIQPYPRVLILSQ